jgi:oligoribonuclease (3'-5' exoribonuclease)
VSSDSIGSKLSTFKKLNETFYINNLDIREIKTWAVKKYPEINKNIIEQIVDSCKSDKRLLISTIEFIKKSGNTGIQLSTTTATKRTAHYSN